MFILWPKIAKNCYILHCLSCVRHKTYNICYRFTIFGSEVEYINDFGSIKFLTHSAKISVQFRPWNQAEFCIFHCFLHNAYNIGCSGTQFSSVVVYFNVLDVSSFWPNFVKKNHWILGPKNRPKFAFWPNFHFQSHNTWCVVMKFDRMVVQIMLLYIYCIQQP